MASGHIQGTAAQAPGTKPGGAGQCSAAHSGVAQKIPSCPAQDERAQDGATRQAGACPNTEARRNAGDTAAEQARLGVALTVLANDEQADISAVRDLIARGADVDTVNTSTNSALVSAAFHGRADIVEALLLAGAKLDQTEAEGHTALHWAVRHKANDIVGLLLRAGADADLKTDNGDTALVWAVLVDNRDATRMLLDAGAELELLGGADMTAYEHAHSLGRLVIRSMLVAEPARRAAARVEKAVRVQKDTRITPVRLALKSRGGP